MASDLEPILCNAFSIEERTIRPNPHPYIEKYMSLQPNTESETTRLDSDSPKSEAMRNQWIVIAAYNEGSRLKDTLQGLCDRYTNIVVVDDGSEDDTGACALQYPVWLLRHVVNCGQGAALQTGIDFALRHGAEVVVTFDADGQHSAHEIETLVEPIRGGQYDVALGSRFLGQTIGMVWTRWVVLKLGVLFTRVFSRIRVTDCA